MPTPRAPDAALALALFLAGFCASAPVRPADARGGSAGLGSTPSEALVEAWDIDVSPSGENLPEGRGTVGDGERIYADACAGCHGRGGGGGWVGPRLVGGRDTLASDDPIRTVGSYWPYATTLYDYIRRAMPFDAPQSLEPDEVYALTAYLLHLDGIVPGEAVMDRQTLPAVEMPNRDGFERTDTVTAAPSEACMRRCTPLALP